MTVLLLPGTSRKAHASRFRRSPGGYGMGGCLDGVRVLELACYQAGPRGGMILSDLGAEVIKIEKPGGEETRRAGPLVRGQSVYFAVYNRGKKSLCLDPRQQRGREIFAALVKKADIVLQNFRPGVMDRMGFGYDRLRALKEDIILCSVSGFGQYGPYRDRPAFDPLGQAMSGLMSLTGKPVGMPLGTASSIVDRYTALHATIGMLAALRHRDRTGEGQQIDVCLLDSALTMVEIPTSYYLATGEEGGEGGRPPYRARDGWVVISASGQDMATRLLRIATGDDTATAGADRFSSRSGPDDPRGGAGPASVGARDAGRDGGRDRRPDVPARPDDQTVEEQGPSRAGADPRPAYRRDPVRPARITIPTRLRNCAAPRSSPERPAPPSAGGWRRQRAGGAAPIVWMTSKPSNSGWPR